MRLWLPISLLLIFCAIPRAAHAQAGAPPIQVCNDAGVESGGDGCTLSKPTTANNLMIITLNLSNTTMTATASSSCVTTFTATPHSPKRGSTASVWIFYGVTSGGCQNMDVSFSAGSTYGSVLAMEYPGMKTSGILDCDDVGNSGTGTAWSSPGCATSNAIDVILAIGATDLTGTTCNTGIGGFTTLISTGGTAHSEQVMDQNTATTGTYSAACTAVNSTSYAMLTAAFEQSGSTPTAAYPTISPGTGGYTSPTTVTMTCSTPSSTIRYTNNGTTPTSGSTAYSSPFSQATPATVQAICTASGYLNSGVTTIYYFAGTPTKATLPQATVSLTMPTQGTGNCPTLTTGSNCKRTPASGSATDFQNALNAATCGDTIILAAGSTYSGDFDFPSTACSGWIVVESSALASLPTSGNRVSPSNVSNMPEIATNGNTPALSFLPSSNHWRLIGLYMTSTYNGDIPELAIMGYQSDNSTQITVTAQLPNQIIFDRCYFYGSLVHNTTRAMFANAQAFAVVDSYIDQIVNTGFDAQDIVTTNGTGPQLIQNNFMQATGEDILYGGSDPAITNLIPSDITIIGNILQKDVADWMGQAPGADVKNLFEIKNAQRVLADGNVFQYDWVAAQHQAIIFRSVNQNGGCTWCSALDITLTHNLIQHVPIAITLAPSYDDTSIGAGRITIQNNVVSDASAANWGGYGEGYQLSAASTGTPLMHDIIIDHNTQFNDQSWVNVQGIVPATIVNLQLTNNIADFDGGGLTGQGITSGTNVLTTFASGYVYNDVVFTTTTQASYPSGTLWSTNLAGVGFTSYTGTDPDISGNLQLTSGSAYHNVGTDSKDIGVYDWTCFNTETAAALAGTFSQAIYCGPAFGNNTAPGSVVVTGVTVAKGASVQ